MPEDGRRESARLHGSQTHHLRTLQALHDSLFAPQFRALETYGATPPPAPSLADVIAAAKSTLEWHRSKEIEVAAELADRRATGGNPVLIDEAARALAHHRAEQERIAGELAAMAADRQAAE
jgi:hypothetical protein